MNKKYVLLLILLCGISGSFVKESVSAVNYDQKIKEIEQDKKEFEKKTNQLQKDIEEIEASRENAMKYIEKLDKKSGELESELEDLKVQIQGAEAELVEYQKELSQAEAERQKQYTTMKSRIKYMYENGNQEYIEILFGATGMTDLLNRSEYVQKIADYDKTMFERYSEIQKKVQEKSQKKQLKLQELETLKNQTKSEKQTVKKLRANKKKKLKQMDQRIEQSQDEIDEYTRQAIEAENEVERLLQKKQDEIDKEMAAGSGDSGDHSKGLSWPLRGGGGRLSSGFGHRSSPTAGASSNHKGIDLAIASGTPIIAAGSGSVVTATYSSSAGNYVMIAHGNRLYTVYMHCSRLSVKVGDQVTKGQVIAYVGSTGISTGAHLHFGVSKNGTYVNPLNYVSR